MDIFERASRRQLRFDSQLGLLTTEQLWQLPLTAKLGRTSLDGLARATHTELKGLEEASFVEVKPDPNKIDAELRLDILKHVIASKLADKAAAEKAADNAERKRKLMSALGAKEEADLAGMTREQIEAEIAKLDS